MCEVLNLSTGDNPCKPEIVENQIVPLGTEENGKRKLFVYILKIRFQI